MGGYDTGLPSSFCFSPFPKTGTVSFLSPLLPPEPRPQSQCTFDQETHGCCPGPGSVMGCSGSRQQFCVLLSVAIFYGQPVLPFFRLSSFSPVLFLSSVLVGGQKSSPHSWEESTFTPRGETVLSRDTWELLSGS